MIENRRFERVPFLCEAALTLLPEGGRVPARSLDISLGGVGLVTEAALAPGRLVSVSLFLKGPSQTAIEERVVGRVVHFHADVDANRVGVEFLEPLGRSQNPELVRKLLKL